MASYARSRERGAQHSPLLLPVVLLGVFIMPISIAGAAIALPAISRDLGTDATALQGVVNGFNIALTVSTLVWGQLAGRVGIRRTFLIGLMTVAAGAVMSAFSVGLVMLDIARVLTGFGAAAIATGGTTILSQAYRDGARARAFALLGMVVGVGLAACPTLSGLLVAQLGWRGVFGVIAVVAGLVLLASLRKVLPSSERHRGSSRGQVLDLSPLRQPRFLAIVLVPVAGSVAFVPVLTYLPVAMSAVHDMGSAAAGLFLLPLTLPVLVGPILAGLLITRTRVSSWGVIAAALIMLVLGDLLFVLFSPALPTLLLVIPMLLVGFGWGLPLGLVDGEALGALPGESAAAAAGVLNFLRLGSEAFAVAAFGFAMSSILSGALGDPGLANAVAAGAPGHADVYANGFRVALVVAALVTSLIAAAVVTLRRRAERLDARIGETGRSEEFAMTRQEA